MCISMLLKNFCLCHEWRGRWPIPGLYLFHLQTFSEQLISSQNFCTLDIFPLSNFSIRHFVKDINLYQSIPIAQKIKTNKRKNEFKKLNFVLLYICFTIFCIRYLVKFFFHFCYCVKIHLVEDTWVLCKHIGNNDATKN